MGRRRSLRFVAWLLTLVAGIGIGTAIGQQSPPADSKGVDAQVVSTVDLAPDMSGYQLRLRKLTFEPGGVAGIHSHKDRPAFAADARGLATRDSSAKVLNAVGKNVPWLVGGSISRGTNCASVRAPGSYGQ